MVWKTETVYVGPIVRRGHETKKEYGRKWTRDGLPYNTKTTELLRIIFKNKLTKMRKNQVYRLVGVMIFLYVSSKFYNFMIQTP